MLQEAARIAFSLLALFDQSFQCLPFLLRGAAMLQTQDVFDKAIAVRNSLATPANGTPAVKAPEMSLDEFNALRDVVNEWVKRWVQKTSPEDLETQFKEFVEVLKTSEQLR